MNGLYRQDLLFSKRPIRSATEELMRLADFKVLFAKVKRADKRVQALPNNTQAVKTTLNGVEVQHKSLAAVTKWLEQETGMRCSRATLTSKYLDKNIDYLGYKLERVNSNHPGYRTSQSK